MRLAYLTMLGYWKTVRPVTAAVRIILLQDNQVLMLRQTYRSGWHFPGGMVDKGETLQEAAQREAREEVGATCLTKPQLFGIFSNFSEGKSDHIAVFICDDVSVMPLQDQWEIAEIRWFPLNDLPSDASGGCLRRIEEYLNGEMGIAGRW